MRVGVGNGSGSAGQQSGQCGRKQKDKGTSGTGGMDSETEPKVTGTMSNRNIDAVPVDIWGPRSDLHYVPTIGHPHNPYPPAPRIAEPSGPSLGCTHRRSRILPFTSQPVCSVLLNPSVTPGASCARCCVHCRCDGRRGDRLRRTSSLWNAG